MLIPLIEIFKFYWIFFLFIHNIFIIEFSDFFPHHSRMQQQLSSTDENAIGTCVKDMSYDKVWSWWQIWNERMEKLWIESSVNKFIEILSTSSTNIWIFEEAWKTRNEWNLNSLFCCRLLDSWKIFKFSLINSVLICWTENWRRLMEMYSYKQIKHNIWLWVGCGFWSNINFPTILFAENLHKFSLLWVARCIFDKLFSFHIFSAFSCRFLVYNTFFAAW